MNKSDFEKLQLTQMEIMDEVHRVCCENNITYYIIGGTALGAIRHGGYIPWDLDIDIAMPRADYDKFAEISSSVLSNRFRYRNFKNTKNFMYPHSLVCINNTFLSTKYGKLNQHEANVGIYLDIFPLDVAPVDKTLQKQQEKNLIKIKKMKKLKRAYRYKNNIKNTIFKKVISLLMFWTNIDKINELFDQECRKYENEDTGLWCSMASHYKYKKQCMPADIYGTPKLIKFEDRMYYAPEKIEEYLTRIYGDYIKLPPEEEQNANLDIFAEVIFDN